VGSIIGDGARVTGGESGIAAGRSCLRDVLILEHERIVRKLFAEKA